MSGALRRLAASSTIAGFLLLPAVTEAGKDPVAVARRYVLRQRTGEAELGTRLVLGPPVSTGARDRWTCVEIGRASGREGAECGGRVYTLDVMPSDIEES